MDVLAIPEDARLASLRAATASIQARWGSTALVRARERIDERHDEVPAALSSGIPALDGLTSIGGLPLGRVSLCLGDNGSGRMLVAGHLLARGSRECAAALLLDLRRHADPWLMGLMGARLDRLLVLRPARGDDLTGALEAVLAMVRAGVGCVVVDLPPGVGSNAAWEPFAPTLATACARENAMLLVMGEAAGEPLRYASSLTIRLQRLDWLIRHGDVTGTRLRATVEKTKLGAPGAMADFELAYPLGTFMPPLAITGEALTVSHDVPGARESAALQVTGTPPGARESAALQVMAS